MCVSPSLRARAGESQRPSAGAGQPTLSVLPPLSFSFQQSKGRKRKAQRQGRRCRRSKKGEREREGGEKGKLTPAGRRAGPRGRARPWPGRRRGRVGQGAGRRPRPAATTAWVAFDRQTRWRRTSRLRLSKRREMGQVPPSSSAWLAKKRDTQAPLPCQGRAGKKVNTPWATVLRDMGLCVCVCGWVRVLMRRRGLEGERKEGPRERRFGRLAQPQEDDAAGADPCVIRAGDRSPKRATFGFF